jgi:hypothetical protein
VLNDHTYLDRDYHKIEYPDIDTYFHLDHYSLFNTCYDRDKHLRPREAGMPPHCQHGFYFGE